MRKKYLVFGLVLALLLTTIAPGVVLAKKAETFNASGVITGISVGDVKPAGNSGRWIVADREITGVIDGDISGEFSLVYHANIESIETQAGNFAGKLEVGQYTISVNGSIEPLTMVPSPLGVLLPMLTISGKWAMNSGNQGHGSFEGWVIFIPTPDGHVGQIIASGIELYGQWHP